MIYVFPHFKSKEKEISKIQGISRLFAYPKEPHFENRGEKVILDSGAFGLSLSGGKINLNYMKKLNEHYLKYANKNTLCIAPDEFLNPQQSMQNFKVWINAGFYKNITAVLQCSKKGIVDTNEIIEQLKFYSKYNVKTYCFSNNALTGEMALSYDLNKIFLFMKDKMQVEWLHVLGAGWSLEDIKNWQSLGSDSIDSIAYYNTKNENEFGSLNPIENIYKILEVVENENELFKNNCQYGKSCCHKS